jgi:hypothetical protein
VIPVDAQAIARALLAHPICSNACKGVVDGPPDPARTGL